MLALLAALGIGVSQFRSQSPTPPAPLSKRTVSAPKTTEQGVGVYEHSAAYLIDEFLDTSPPPIQSDEPWSLGDQPSVAPANTPPGGEPFPVRRARRKLRGSARLGKRPPVALDWERKPGDPRQNDHVDFLIAMLPEPASPPLRYQFDAEFRAIQIATGQADYTLATFDLPWVHETEDESHEFRLGEEIDLSTSGELITIKPNTEDENRSERDRGSCSSCGPKTQKLKARIYC